MQIIFNLIDSLTHLESNLMDRKIEMSAEYPLEMMLRSELGRIGFTTGDCNYIPNEYSESLLAGEVSVKVANTTLGIPVGKKHKLERINKGVFKLTIIY